LRYLPGHHSSKINYTSVNQKKKFMTKKTLFLHYKKRVQCFLILSVFLMQPAFHVYSNTLESNSQKNQSTGQAANQTIKDILNHIERNSKYIFIYSEDVHKILGNKVSISLSNKKVEAILDELCAQTGITYKTSGRQITITAPPVKTQKKSPKEKVKVIGNVTDMNGEPLIGVSVALKNDPALSVITDESGSYNIMVPDNSAVLQFKFIGFAPKEETIDKRKIVNVVLQEGESKLDEVVVVAYGSQRKESVVGSITTISPGKLKIGTSRSISNNLAGTVSGIIGVQRSGEPGYDNSSFWIRGISTFQGARNPLVLVDGIERSLNNIDPDEIESFSVLKDASASAVYGVRGANGVILVNTKRGKISKPTVVLRSEFAKTAPVRLPDYIGSAQYMQLLDDIRVDNGYSPIYTNQIAKTKANYDPDLYPDVDWINEVTKDNASNQRVTLDISGGSERLRYSFVAAYYSEDGILARDVTKEWDSSIKLKRYNMRSNIDMNLTPTTSMRFNIGGYLQDRNAPPQGIDFIFLKSFVTPPFAHPKQYSTGEIAMTEEPNPWALSTQTGYTRSSASQLETLFSLEQDLKSITPGLKAKVSFSFDRYSVSSVSRSKKPDYYSPATGRTEEGDLVIALKSAGDNFLGYTSSADWGNKSTYLEGNLNYSRTFGIHSFDGLFIAQRRNYDNGSQLPFRNQGLAGRLSYTLSGRYITEFNFGYNGSENFAKGHRYGFFPSVAAGWILSEESFMEPLRDKISKLKIRASYGQVGNDQLDGRRFAYIPTIATVDGYYYGADRSYSIAGYSEGDFGIPNLSWETVNKMNLGLELGLFQGAVEAQVDYFDERRRDIFMQRSSIPATGGYSKLPWDNLGKVNNKGIEVSLNVNKQFNKNLFIGFFGNMTYANNKIIEMDEPYTVVGSSRAQTGHSVGQWFGLVADGLFTSEDFSDENLGILNPEIPTHTYGIVRPGDIKYKDINGDKKIDALDKTAIGGTFNPKIVYGLGLNMKYKHVDFGVMLQGNGKTYNMVGNGSGSFIPGSGNGAVGNILSNVNDRWTKENPSQDVFYPRLSMGLSSNNSQASTWWLKDVSMLRLKNLELGYSIPTGLMRQMHLTDLRIILRGTNLLTFSDFKLWDPEMSTTTGSSYPIMKSLSAGFELRF